MNKNKTTQRSDFVTWFRASAPYIHAFRGRTFVVSFGGEVLKESRFTPLAHDLALLNALGIRLVLVYGARPQIEARLKQQGAELRYAGHLRVTDARAMACVTEAAAAVRVEIEALLSLGVVNSPMHGARIRVVSGNFVTARPIGVRDGVDHGHTGTVRRVDAGGIRAQLDLGAVVLLSPVAYSPTGEVFNVAAEEVATAAAIALQADKLIFLTGQGLADGRRRLVRELTTDQARALLEGRRRLDAGLAQPLAAAVRACTHGVERAHLIDRHVDGGLLLELFTRDGVGTLVTSDVFEGTRQATVEDIPGLLELIAPLEKEGILVRRSREQLELELDHFTVMERDGMVVACAALYPFIDEHVGELACLAVHPDYRGRGRGDVLLEYVQRRARQLGLKRLFVLTTQSAHWFRERGFVPAELADLPVKRRDLYNYRRNSKVFVRDLDE